MSFTKQHGNRLLVLLGANWLGSLFVAFAVSVLSGREVIPIFIVAFAICIAAIVLVLLWRRDLLSSLLMIGGGLIAFALTEVSATLLRG